MSKAIHSAEALTVYWFSLSRLSVVILINSVIAGKSSTRVNRGQKFAPTEKKQQHTCDNHCDLNVLTILGSIRCRFSNSCWQDNTAGATANFLRAITPVVLYSSQSLSGNGGGGGGGGGGYLRC